jgi:hypothetical protein
MWRVALQALGDQHLGSLLAKQILAGRQVLHPYRVSKATRIASQVCPQQF